MASFSDSPRCAKSSACDLLRDNLKRCIRADVLALLNLVSTTMKNTTILSQGQLQLRKKLRLGTWNIRSMLQPGKVQLLGDEMMRLGVDICGLSEVRWNGQGHFTTLDGHTVVYSGRLTQGMSGVAVWIHRKIAGHL